jgi:flagellar hook assembly protein FlgD
LYEVVNDPNPINDHTTFRFTQPSGGGAIVDATLRLYTTDGRLVRTLTARSAESVVEMNWDGRDEAGARVANGAYAFHVTVENTATGTTSEAGGMCVVSH